MVERHQEMKVVRTPICYKHLITVTYPKDNVKAMIESWKKTVEQADDFVRDSDAMLQGALEDGYRRLEEQVALQKSEVAKKLTIPKEELVDTLLKGYYKELEQIQNGWKEEELAKVKEEFKEQLTAELNRQKEKHLMEREEKQKALDLWTKPEDE